MLKNLVGDNQVKIEETDLDTQSPTWRTQVKKDLAALQQHTLRVIADVGEIVEGVIAPGRILTAKYNVDLNVTSISPNLMTTIHRTALRQILLTAIGKLVQSMSSGEIVLGAEKKGDFIDIIITGQPATATTSLTSDFIEETLAMQDGSIEVLTEADCITFQIVLPAADKIKVLVVDDNVDLVHFYRRYTVRTKYEIFHVAEGEHFFTAIEDVTPDIIVLDVMLPDVDGWELLTHLQRHPVAGTIPVIVCSVVRREELALALGAALYIPKPVRRQQFIQALEQVLPQTSITGMKTQENSEATV